MGVRVCFFCIIYNVNFVSVDFFLRDLNFWGNESKILKCLSFSFWKKIYLVNVVGGRFFLVKNNCFILEDMYILNLDYL